MSWWRDYRNLVQPIMKYNDNDRAIALAGLFQACHLVQQIANKGIANSEAMNANIQSLFQLETDRTLDVYGKLENIELGIRLAHQQLSGDEARDNQLTRYLLSLVQLERKLRKDKTRLENIRQGIQLATPRLEHFPATHSNILAALADIYSENISTLKPRIMVSGEPVYLQNTDNVSRIRTLLLSGIRAAMLWRQTGGRRRQLLFNRKPVIEALEALLRSI